jgi:hypothetical protein
MPSPQGVQGRCAMKPQIPLEQILLVWHISPRTTVAAETLGISRRTLFDCLEKASLTELRGAIGQLQVEAAV